MFAPSRMSVNDAIADIDEHADEMPMVKTSTTTKQRQRLVSVNFVASWAHAAAVFVLATAAAMMLIAFLASTMTISDTDMVKSSMEQPAAVSPSLTLRRVLSAPSTNGAMSTEKYNVFHKDAASLTTIMASSATTTAEGADAEEGMRCNGLANLCNVPVNQALFLTLHNAMASADENFFILPNHSTRLEEALVAGFRGLDLDVGTCDGQVAMYHTFCWLGSRNGETVFRNIATFLDENPHEVLMLTFQLQDNVSLEAVYQSMDAAGLAQSIYVHNSDPSSSSSSSWPTLQSLITEHKKRVVLFHYNGENHCNGDPTFSACPPGMHYWFQYGVNTQFSFDSIAELQNDEYACQLTATPGVSQSTRDFFKLNIFLTIPSQLQSSSLINTLSFAREQMQKCSSWTDGAKVSLLVHDFWDEGDLLQLAQAYNEQLEASDDNDQK